MSAFRGKTAAAGKLVFDPDDGYRKKQSPLARGRLNRFGEERYGFAAFRVDQKQRRGNISYDHQPGGGLDQHFGVHRKRPVYPRSSLFLPVGWIERKQLAAGICGIFNEERHATLCREADESTDGTRSRGWIESFKVVQTPGYQNRLCFIVRSQ